VRQKKIEGHHTTELGNRRLHIWRGRSRETDIAALCDAIAATGEIFNHDGSFVRLDGDGKIVPIHFADMAEAIGRCIVSVRVVVHDEVARKEFYPFPFDTAPRALPRIEDHGKPLKPTSGPDAAVLEQLYRTELLWRLPRIETDLLA
jgi:hypothetical protein